MLMLQSDFSGAQSWPAFVAVGTGAIALVNTSSDLMGNDPIQFFLLCLITQSLPGTSGEALLSTLVTLFYSLRIGRVDPNHVRLCTATGSLCYHPVRVYDANYSCCTA